MKQFIITLFLILGFVVNAQPPKKFYSTYGGNGYDVGYDVKQTLDGGYIITGSTSSYGQGNTDMYLLKIDSMGQKVFQSTFGGVSNEIGKSVVQLTDSSYVMAGYTSSSGVGGYDVFLVKADKAGNLIWQKTIGGADWDFANSMDTTSDGGFIIAGTTYSYGKGNADGYVIKTDANGDTTWTKTYGGLKDDEFKSVIQTSDGNYALAGYTKSYNDSLGDAWIFKLDQNGDSILCKFHGGNKEDFANSISQLENLDLIISGATRSSSTAGNSETEFATFDLLTINLTHSYIDISSVNEYYNDITQGINGYIVGCGSTKSIQYSFDGVVDIYNSGYNYYNAYSVGANNQEELYAVCKTKDKGYATVGKTNGYNSSLDDIFLIKMDSTGNYGTSIIGIEEKELVKIVLGIYPNPTSDYINIKISNYKSYKKLHYQIIDLNGRVIFSNMINELIKTVETSSLSDGLYLLQIFDSNNLLSSSKISIIK
jgi:hypothetical protein